MAYSKNIKQENKKLFLSDNDSILHNNIESVLREYGLLMKQYDWNESQVNTRSFYDTRRIFNLINEHLNILK
jgi:hypothetical protein